MKIFGRIFKKRRSEEDMLLSTLDSIAFVALHGSQLPRWLAKIEYNALRRNMQNGRIRQAETRMKLVHAEVSKEIEARLKER